MPENKVISFLKKLGQMIVSTAGIAAGVGPIILPFLGSSESAKVAGVAVNDLTAVASTIVQVEAVFATIPGSTGAQKLAAAIPLVGNIIRTSELVAGKKVADEALFTKAIEEYAQATVDLLNSLHEDAAKSA